MRVVGCIPGVPRRGWTIRDLSGDVRQCEPITQASDPPVSWPLALWPAVEQHIAKQLAEQALEVEFPPDAIEH